MEKLTRPPLYSDSTIFMKFVLLGSITPDYGLMAKYMPYNVMKQQQVEKENIYEVDI